MHDIASTTPANRIDPVKRYLGLGLSQSPGSGSLSNSRLGHHRRRIRHLIDHRASRTKGKHEETRIQIRLMHVEIVDASARHLELFMHKCLQKLGGRCAALSVCFSREPVKRSIDTKYKTQHFPI